MNITDINVFFNYAMKYYRVSEKKKIFISSFKKWYKSRTKKEFNYANFLKEETDVNCTSNDTYLQSVACAYNINRDRGLVENMEKLIKKYDRVLLAYGTGHFVQEYPALVKAFGQPPEYLKP